MRTNVHYLVYHLTIADAITCFVTLPMETIWRATIEVSRYMVMNRIYSHKRRVVTVDTVFVLYDWISELSYFVTSAKFIVYSFPWPSGQTFFLQ